MSISPATLEATITALKKSSLFSGFDDAALRHLSALCSEESACDGALLMRQGDEGSFAYILLGGHVDAGWTYNADPFKTQFVQQSQFSPKLTRFDFRPTVLIVTQ